MNRSVKGIRGADLDVEELAVLFPVPGFESAEPVPGDGLDMADDLSGSRPLEIRDIIAGPPQRTHHPAASFASTKFFIVEGRIRRGGRSIPL
jgi:hypothetical protein